MRDYFSVLHVDFLPKFHSRNVTRFFADTVIKHLEIGRASCRERVS